jgi:acyl phosphate:glycerol-3-phosphate acyltransferase
MNTLYKDLVMNHSMTYFFLIAAYLIGSIPFAYLITHRATGKDLRSEGSGNIGTRNAYEVTNSKKIGVVVLTLDLLKGLLPTLLLFTYGYIEYIPICISAIVIGHCYPVWLRFHGGRGLAPAAGIALLVQPFALIIWVQVYFLSAVFKRNVHVNAALATIASAIIVLALPQTYFYNPLLLNPDNGYSLFSLRVALLVIQVTILTKHYTPLKELITDNT